MTTKDLAAIAHQHGFEAYPDDACVVVKIPCTERNGTQTVRTFWCRTEGELRRALGY